MKILLVNPPHLDGIVADMSDYFDESSGSYPPLGLMYLASYLQSQGHNDVQLLDAAAGGLDYDSTLARIATLQPELIGITALTFNFPTVVNLARKIKAAHPAIPIVIGGPHASIFPDETLALPFVDYVVIGEGEITFHALITTLADGRSPEGLRSVGWKREGAPVIDRNLTFIDDLNSLPFPALHLTDHTRYASVLSARKHTMVMMSSRGCPFHCIYCDRPHLGKRFRARSASNVVDEMLIYRDRYGIHDIKFFDDTFTVDRKRVLAICEEISKRAPDMTWTVRARVNTVDEELLRTMRSAGLTAVSFGIESGNQTVLDTLQKGITLAQVEQAVKACRRLGIEVLGDFIIGSPGEQREQIMESIRFACRLPLDYAQFTIMTPYPSTQLYALGMERGIIPSDYWREFARNPLLPFVTPVWTEFYTKEQLVGFLKLAYRRFYFRPTYMLRRLRRIQSPTELWRKFKVLLSLLRMTLAPKKQLSGNFRNGEGG